MTEYEYAVIKRRLRALLGIDLDCYKSPQMMRRLDGYLARTGAPSWAVYLHEIERDPQAQARLRDFITINVSHFFRDRPKWDDLRYRVLPQIVRRHGLMRAWSAGCSHGAEAYSLAILFHEMSDIVRYEIRGTDIDRSILQRARAGGPYSAEDVREVPADWLARYFHRDSQGYWIRDCLKQRVHFLEEDLLQTTATGEFDLIVCRNVLIYFTEAAKAQVINRLTQALRPGGVLFLGATENIPQGRASGLERLSMSAFYRRVGS
jgi:chemotaxis protein methyltransferase CheR